MLKMILVISFFVFLPFINCYCCRYYPNQDNYYGCAYPTKDAKSIIIHIKNTEERPIRCEKISATGLLFLDGNYVGQREYSLNGVELERSSSYKLTHFDVENIAGVQTLLSQASVTLVSKVNFKNCDYQQLFYRDPMLYTAASILLLPVVAPYVVTKSMTSVKYLDGQSCCEYPSCKTLYDKNFDIENGDLIVAKISTQELGNILINLFKSSSTSGDSIQYCRELIQRHHLNPLAYATDRLDKNLINRCLHVVSK